MLALSILFEISNYVAKLSLVLMALSWSISFAKGRPGRGTGYDLDEEDILEMEQCRGIVVVSAIFSNARYILPFPSFICVKPIEFL